MPVYVYMKTVQITFLLQFWLSQSTKAQDISVFINKRSYIISDHRRCKRALSFLAEVFFIYMCFLNFLVVIGHFRITASLFFKASPGAHPFI